MEGRLSRPGLEEKLRPVVAKFRARFDPAGPIERRFDWPQQRRVDSLQPCRFFSIQMTNVVRNILSRSRVPSLFSLPVSSNRLPQFPI